MVYGLLYLPLTLHHCLLAQTHHFDDSKVLTPSVRSNLLEKLCTPGTDLFSNCGWATRTMSARDISANMFKPAVYNLNAQAMDATITLIHQVLAAGINIREIYIDTIGKPELYQRKLERIFPNQSITVAKKADSLYPCVSAASVCAKVTRDMVLDEASKLLIPTTQDISVKGWGSGYPSDARCITWLKGNMDPLFGWSGECRFSWGTAKDLLDKKDAAWKVDWPEDSGGGCGEYGTGKLSGYFRGRADDEDGDEIAGWWGSGVEEIVL